MAPIFSEIISLENLFCAWEEFVRGKSGKGDVQFFARNLSDNILTLRDELANKTYTHGGYHAFRLCDPKPRHIHKASVRDRVLHHAIYRVLYPFFDRKFIPDSFSCRVDKGSHAAGARFRRMADVVSRNHTRTCWVLQCDVRKFFASIHQDMLEHILQSYIDDADVVWLLKVVIRSFHAEPSIGLPLGNLTSQLFVNIYMHEFDLYMKQQIRAHWYIRYADDFAILSHDREWLDDLLPSIRGFLSEHLGLSLHPHKVSIRTLASGVDFLGWVHFSHHRVLRTATKHRIWRRIAENPSVQVIQSYLGLLGHGNAYKIEQELRNMSLLFHENY